MVEKHPSKVRVDAVDARILNWLVRDVSMPFRTIAAKVGIDERTVARRVQTMKKQGVFRETAEIDWVDLGTVTVAYVGCKTSAGDEQRAKLYKFISGQPRIVESFLTVGQSEYLLKTVTGSVRELREEVLMPMEPLTSDLSTSIISSQIKRPNYSSALSLLEV
ncbi:MAG: Lrp/AsnC family transcriptional regulator [Thaumarchaeota archaeon]|nr:Lrp/AsnC family transcriptional regulator [Nitrososphaerota archaeon]